MPGLFPFLPIHLPERLINSFVVAKLFFAGGNFEGSFGVMFAVCSFQLDVIVGSNKSKVWDGSYGDTKALTPRDVTTLTECGWIRC